MKVHQESTIITVTGTKGKTSVARLLHFVVNSISRDPVLRVDTNSVMLGVEKKFGLYDSWRNAGFVPTVCPGRFLILLHGLNQQTAILEAAVGSSRVGLGYRSHNIGIFTNVYDDHVGMKEYLKTRDDLADAKTSFIFGKIRKNGVAVFNADDQLVMDRLAHIPEDRNVRTVACTTRECSGDYDVTIVASGDSIVLRVKGVKEQKLHFKEYPWTLGGKHLPTIYNFMSVVGSLWGMYGDSPQFTEAIDVLKKYSFDPDGGRMVEYKTQDDIRVIVDFAHEKESLRYVAEYAHTVKSSAGKVLGVIRLDGSRPKSHIEMTGAYIAPYFDECFVYDKEESNGDISDGVTADLLATSIRKAGTAATCYGSDTDALKAARVQAKAGDVVIYIISTFDKGRSRAQDIFESKGNI